MIKPYTLHTGKSEIVLLDYPDNHFHSCVTDPPYGLKFMNNHWDYQVPSVAQWKEIFRVMRPGAYLLAFGGPPTYHRVVCNIEDAGFEIRDQIFWTFASGFPKSMDVSKAIDKAAGADRKIVGTRKHPTLKNTELLEESANAANAAHGENEWSREWDITDPATELAQQWKGWGTALKPAHEPICVARKPFTGTVAKNIQQFQTGAINIDACRIDGEPWKFGTQTDIKNQGYGSKRPSDGHVHAKDVVGGQNGRWPANLIHDGSEEVLAHFPESKGQQGDVRGDEPSHTGDENTTCYGEYDRVPFDKRNDSGSAARFFYCAKTSRADRNEGCEHLDDNPLLWSSGTQNPGSFQSEGTKKSSPNNHATVKPTDLMRYLCRLVTVKGGHILDPFAGSGSTGKAALFEHMEITLIDSDAQWLPIQKCRLDFALKNRDNQTNLFD